MKQSTERILNELTERYAALTPIKNEVKKAYETLYGCFVGGGRVYLCGNGGSAADCEHISGELLKGFLQKREPRENVPSVLQQGVAAIPLPSLSASLSAFANDVEPSLVYAQLTYALGRPGDVFMGISTSGNSKNVVEAAEVARRLGLVTIALTGASGGKLADICHVTIRVPENETYLVQELHLPVYHAICAEVEERLFG